MNLPSLWLPERVTPRDIPHPMLALLGEANRLLHAPLITVTFPRKPETMTLEENLTRFRHAPGVMPYEDLVQVRDFFASLRAQLATYISVRYQRDALAPENAGDRVGELNCVLADAETAQWYVDRAAPPTGVVTAGAEEGCVIIDISMGRPL